jgi:outer membrane protein assembly factor BamB
MVASERSDAALASDPIGWPMFRGDAAGQGVARGVLPARPKLLWTFSVERGGFTGTAAIQNATVYVGSTDGNLYALGLSDKRRRWTFPTKSGFSAPAAVRRHRVVIGDSARRVRRL